MAGVEESEALKASEGQVDSGSPTRPSCNQRPGHPAM